MAVDIGTLPSHINLSCGFPSSCVWLVYRSKVLRFHKHAHNNYVNHCSRKVTGLQPTTRKKTLSIAKRHGSIPQYRYYSMVLYHSIDITSIQIEDDWLIFISTIKNTTNLSWDMMALWRKALEMLTSLSARSIHHCKRSANRVADFLAITVQPGGYSSKSLLPTPNSRSFSTGSKQVEAYNKAFYHLPGH